jgi:DNA end-binding protein Ku
MVSRPIWRGYLRLALVSCPVAMFNARSERSSIHFNLINPDTGNRIKMVTKDSETGNDLQRSALVKGYEYSKGRYLILSDEDLDSVKVESSAIMSVEKFVEADSIDPIYYDDSYYLVPDAKAGEDVYAVLREAIAKTGKIALTRVVISQRERTVALRHAGSGLMAHTLYEERDLNKADRYFDEVAHLKVEPEMVDLAVQLINRQSAKYDPADLEDRYETRLRAMIDAKLAGMPMEADEEKPSMRGNVIDLVAALRKSLSESTAAETRVAKGAPKGPPPRKGPPQPASKAPRKRA